ncbi:MAG: hypothetical protein R2912_12180 [Eubacteriales bacterium]
MMRFVFYCVDLISRCGSPRGDSRRHDDRAGFCGGPRAETPADAYHNWLQRPKEQLQLCLQRRPAGKTTQRGRWSDHGANGITSFKVSIPPTI